MGDVLLLDLSAGYWDVRFVIIHGSCEFMVHTL